MSTLFVDASEPAVTHAVITKVWTDGRAGEDKDYFADHCDGVTVTINTNAVTETAGVASKVNVDASKTYELVAANADQIALLKKCLGDADATSTNNVDIYDWDTGDDDYPHLVKLVRTVTTYNDGGYYVAIKYVAGSNAGQFEMLNPFRPPDATLSDTYELYTTKGTLSRVSRQAQAHFGFGQKKVFTIASAQADYAAGATAQWAAFNATASSKELVPVPRKRTR
jgi:hypothetical protein